MKNKYMIRKKAEGITLIALVITIIVLLILAAVSIAMLTGENGILNKSQQTKKEQIKAELEEQLKLAIYELRIEKKENPITLNDITQEALKGKITNSEVKLNVESSDENEVKITMQKNGVKARFKIDGNLNITKIEGGIEFSYTYNVENIQGNQIEVTIYVQEAENGIDKIEIAETSIESFEKGTKEKIKITDTVELGKEYKIKITPVKGEVKEESLLIELNYTITTNLAEGLSIDRKETQIAYNQPYIATITEEAEYMIDKLTVTMGEEVIEVDDVAGIINIPNVTGNIEITATSLKWNELISISSVSKVGVININTTNDISLVTNCLFDKNTNNGGAYKGVILTNYSKTSYLDFNVSRKIKLYGCGHYYSDGGGVSGKSAKFDKWNGTAYTAYTTVPTYANGQYYELGILEEGKYRITVTGGVGYINFDEWKIKTTD